MHNKINEIPKEQLRTVKFDRETINESDRSIELSVSSEYPVDNNFYIEILDHSEKSIRLERFKNGAAVRDTHWGDQIGVIEKAWIDDQEKKLRVKARFSKSQRASEVYQDIIDGIRKNVSIRYMIHKVELESKEEDKETYRVTDWEPVHFSVEADPADHTVGVGRSIENKNENQTQIKVNGGNVMTEQEKRQLEDKHKAEVEAARSSAGEAESKRVKAIYATARMFADKVAKDTDIFKEADKFVGEKRDAFDFSDHVMQKVQEQQALRTSDANIGMTDDEIKKFSIRKAIWAAANGDWSKAGFEREVSVAARQKQPGETRGQITVPFDVLSSGRFGKRSHSQRELTVGTDSAGGYLVGTDHLAEQFIDVLRNKTIMSELNVTMLPGLSGDVQIPKKSAGGSGGWISTEGGDASAADMTVSQISMSPRTIAGKSSFTRKLLLQSNPGIDRLVEDDLIDAIVIPMDKALIHGTGSNGQPQGLENVSGIGDVTGSGFSWSTAVEFKKKVKIANAYKDNMAYLTNPIVEANLETTAKAGSYPVFILQDGRVAGHRLVSTNQINSGYLIFGDFSQAVLGMWGGLDIIVDAISNDDGNVDVKVFQSVDYGFRHPGAFAVSDDVSFT